MNILSLFDGMSCGQIALNKAGIKYDNYFASEIDKYAIQVTKDNFPNTVHLGDVTKIDFKKLPKIDLLIGGSPCQGFSFAGKQLNFNDPRSALFFEFVRALKELNPKWFLLENVRMKKEHESVISEHLGINPILINSSLVSAQNRNRLYWTNIPNVKQPIDKGIVLSDIIEHGLVDMDKSYCIDANYFEGTNLEQYLSKKRRQVVFEKPHGFNKGGFREREKFSTVRHATNVMSARQVGRRISNGRRADYAKDIKPMQRIEVNKNPSKTNCLSTVQKDNLLIDLEMTVRKLTLLECKRLQTVPDDYIMNVSNTQAYKMLGNGWTVDVITHIFKNILNG